MIVHLHVSFSHNHIMADDKSTSLFGDDINATPLDKLVHAPTRFPSEMTSRKSAPPLEPLAYNPTVPVDDPPPQHQPQHHHQQELRQRKRPPPPPPQQQQHKYQATMPPPPAPQPYMPQAPYAPQYYPVAAPQASQPAAAQPKSGWLAKLERHGRAMAVAFLVFAVVWYALPHVTRVAWLLHPSGTGVSMSGALGLAVITAVLFGMVDSYVLTI